MCYTMAYTLTKVYTQMTLDINMHENIFLMQIVECEYMTLAISMLNNIVPLHIKIQNYHLK